MIGKHWMLITAEKDGKANTMTASWGGLGILWGKPVAFFFIRPQRYTKEFVEASDFASLSFFDESKREMLNYCGTVSGRDEDKIAKSNLTLTHVDGAPCFEEAETTLVVRKMYRQDMTDESFLDRAALEKWYEGDDLHTMYIAEIEAVLVR
jgi:flavin reductase (DIM6/NTAB) family NADH-FMN oxidoreductase RutF